MTQTSPKPSNQDTHDQHNQDSKIDDQIISRTTSLEELALDTDTLESREVLPTVKPIPVWQRLRQKWDNVNFQTKLTLLLICGAALPVIVVTQGLVINNKEQALQNLQQSLQRNGKTFAEEYVLWTQVDSQAQAENLAKLIQATEIDLSNSQQISLHRGSLQNFLEIQNGSDPEINKNFQIFTDAGGKIVAQDIQVLDQDSSNTPPLKQASAEQKYRSVSLPVGTNLSNLPIVKDALKTARPLAGMELLKSESLQLLGLDKQAGIGLRTQSTQNLSEAKQPFPQGTYDIDQGKAGLVAVAVHPVKIKNKLVGTVIVGTLLNRNYGLVDKFSQKYSVPVATVFAQDWRVSTNVPYTDGQTRAIGTRVARQVAESVLNQGRDFSGPTSIIGKDYLTFYTPLYNYQKDLNPGQAKPVGMAFVGQSLAQINNDLRDQQLFAYSIGASMLLLIGLAAIPLARSFARPLGRLASFAQQVGAGEQGVRLEGIERQDEIGVLSQELNQMAVSVEANLEARRQEAERTRLFADIASSRGYDSQDLASVFNKAVMGARAILKVERVVVYRFLPNWSGYITAESVADGWPQALANRIEDACIGDQLIKAYKNGRVVPTENVFEAGFHPEHLQLMERLQIKANLVTPIVNNDQLFGLLVAHHCEHTHAWQQTEIDFLRQLASQLGLILDRTSLLEQQQAEAQRSQLIKDITLKLAQLSQATGIFDTAVQEIRLALSSDRVVVYSFNDKWQGTVIAESVAGDWPRALGAEIDDPCFADKYVERYRQGRVQATENIYTVGLTECHLKQLKQFAVQANLVAPILHNGQLLGLLIAHQCSGPRAWQQGEIDLFAQLATQIGFALDRAALLEQQKTAKELLQRRALELLMEVDPVSSGDLTVRAQVTEDEIGTIADSYNATVGSLRKIVTQVQTAAQQVAATTSNNEVSVSELSQDALRQSQEIAVALERIQEMSRSIRAVAVNAAQAEVAVQQANQTVEAGDTIMNRTVAGIEIIRETVAETSQKVKRLGESSQKISKVVKLIGSFADQTNLLALNAAIEAARAGEEGRGFAVVADEVQALASQSTQATTEIESLVREIQTETNEVVAAMEAGTTQVVEGTRLVDETRQSLNNITAVSTQIGALVAAIAAAAATQSQTSETVTQTISDVAAIANQNSNEATLVSASFKELLVVAQDLQASASQFKVS